MRVKIESAWEPVYDFFSDELAAWECRHCENAVCAGEDGDTPEEWGWNFCPFCGFKFGKEDGNG